MISSLSALRAALPDEPLFADKTWHLSPRPFLIDAALADDVEKLGYRLLLFQRACNELYFRSIAGKAPAWVAEYLDRGKPQELVELSRRKETRAELPRVIRPDLILTNEGYTIAELDTVPGGIGLTAWLNQTYAEPGTWDILGGARGMIDGFQAIVPEGRIAISKEAETYKPEMRWIAKQTDGALHVVDAEAFTEPKAHYRFYEHFDLPNLPAAALLASQPVSPPFKPFLEEKLWFALFWARPLRDFWRRELSERHWLALQKVIPRTWIVDPSPVPHHAVIPGLDIQDWRELAAFSQKQRDLIIKISGFSEIGWGSRSITLGSDVSAPEWTAAVERAIGDYQHHTWIVQRFHHARIVEQPYFEHGDDEVRTMRGRVRLCPYYFIKEGKAELCGALATIVPADKKILHGMSAAILAPTGREI